MEHVFRTANQANTKRMNSVSHVPLIVLPALVNQAVLHAIIPLHYGMKCVFLNVHQDLIKIMEYATSVMDVQHVQTQQIVHLVIKVKY